MHKRTFNISKYKPSALQGAFDFNTVSQKQMTVLAIEYPLERLLMNICIAILALLFLAYFYFVIASVMNIIAGKEADAKAAQMQGSIGTLEQTYFSLSQSITPGSASTLGLTPIAQTSYVYRPGNAASAAITDTNTI